jgi:hypothetical protein
MDSGLLGRAEVLDVVHQQHAVDVLPREQHEQPQRSAVSSLHRLRVGTGKAVAVSTTPASTNTSRSALEAIGWTLGTDTLQPNNAPIPATPSPMLITPAPPFLGLLNNMRAGPWTSNSAPAKAAMPPRITSAVPKDIQRDINSTNPQHQNG